MDGASVKGEIIKQLNTLVLTLLSLVSLGRRLLLSFVLPLHKFRVQEYQALIHHLQTVGHLLVVVCELLEYFLGSLLWKLDQKTLRALHVVRCDEQMRVVGADLNDEVALSELLRSLVEHDAVLIEVFCLSHERLRCLAHGLGRVYAAREVSDTLRASALIASHLSSTGTRLNSGQIVGWVELMFVCREISLRLCHSWHLWEF